MVFQEIMKKKTVGTGRLRRLAGVSLGQDFSPDSLLPKS